MNEIRYEEMKMISFRTGTSKPIKLLHSTVNKGLGKQAGTLQSKMKITLIVYSDPWIPL